MWEEMPLSDVSPVMDRDHLLPDGTLIRIEPLRRGDRTAVTGLFARLSPEAKTAVDARDGSVLGIARYVEHEGRPGVADTAVAVADDVQRRGIGTALMPRLIACARANGFHLLTATTLWENRPARALMRSTGFEARGSAGAEIELALELRPAIRRAPDAVRS